MASVGCHCPECVVRSLSGRSSLRQRRSPGLGRTTRGKPVLTGALVVSNIVLFLVNLVESGSIWSVQVTWRDLSYGIGIWAKGATWGQAIDVGGEWWRLVSGAFLHANILHVGFNVLLLWLLGRELEGLMGPFRFGLVYFAALMAGAFGAVLHYPNTPTVGASGGVFGLMGAAIAVQRASGGRIRDSGILGLLILNLITTFTISNISIGGHIGGLVGGGLAAWVICRGSQFASRSSLALRAIFVVALIVGLAFAGLWASSTWMDPVIG